MDRYEARGRELDLLCAAFLEGVEDPHDLPSASAVARRLGWDVHIVLFVMLRLEAKQLVSATGNRRVPDDLRMVLLPEGVRQALSGLRARSEPVASGGGEE